LNHYNIERQYSKKSGMGKNLLHVDLLDETGLIIQHNAFMEKFEIKCSFREFNN